MVGGKKLGQKSWQLTQTLKREDWIIMVGAKPISRCVCLAQGRIGMLHIGKHYVDI
jgi:hypothetical protein